MKYYVLDIIETPRRRIEKYGYYPYMEYIRFNWGRKIQNGLLKPYWITIPDGVTVPADPLECFLQAVDPDSDCDSPEMPEIFEGTIPLFRDDVIAALNEFGVTNIDYYNTVITGADDNSKKYTNYKAANIIMSESYKDSYKLEYIVKHNLPIAWYDVNIIIREDLKEHLLKKGFPSLRFYEVDDVPAAAGDEDLEGTDPMEKQRVTVWGIIVKDPAKNRKAVNGVLDEFKEQLALQSDIPFPKENVTALTLIFTGTTSQLYSMVENLDGLNVSIHDYCLFMNL